jgi:hypothetical protein
MPLKFSYHARPIYRQHVATLITHTLYPRHACHLHVVYLCFVTSILLSYLGLLMSERSIGGLLTWRGGRGGIYIFLQPTRRNVRVPKSLPALSLFSSTAKNRESFHKLLCNVTYFCYYYYYYYNNNNNNNNNIGGLICTDCMTDLEVFNDSATYILSCWLYFSWIR